MFNKLSNLSRTKRASVYYFIISFALILLSLIGIFFNEPITIACMTICSLFGYFNLLLLLKSENDTTPKGIKASFAVLTLFRYVFMAIGMLLSALLIYFTMGTDINSKRYLIVAISALPYFVTTFAIVFAK